MSENLIIPDTADRSEIYSAILPQIEAITAGETNIIANLANISAILKEAFNLFWVGFYIAESDDILVLGPFQGPLACTRIRKGKGVCGTVFATGETLIVDDVELFPGHIACSSLSRSEIVVPIYNRAGAVWGVLDIDSKDIADFDEVDKLFLEELVAQITNII